LSKLALRTAPLLLWLLFAGAKPARAQGFSLFFGGGSATDGATTTPGCSTRFIFDGFTGACETAPTMGGAFGVFGGDYMLNSHLGFDAEYAFRFAQATFLPAAGVKDRPGFYDFNAVYEPSPTTRIVPELEGGIGGARVALYFSQSICPISNVCSTQSQLFYSSNHFQVHGAVGVKFYVTSKMFIKPQFDVHWAANLNQQYARDYVPQYTVSVGYTFGGH
jgi:hypothetical protein